MNIVYLLVHKIRHEENNPPYYYIGSKLNWKGEGTYYSSSRAEFMKDAYPGDLIFTPLWCSDDCTHFELLEKEKEFQISHDVIKNPLFFNRNIANSLMFQSVNEEQRVARFKIKASEINSDGIRNSVAWAAKGREVIKSRYSKEFISERHRNKMNSPLESGELLKDLVWRKMMETSSIVGEDGLNSFQRGGLRIKEVLSEVTASGLTKAQMRLYYGTKSGKFEIFNITFFSVAQACRFLECDKGLVRRLRDGWCSQDTYNKLCRTLGADYMENFKLRIKNPGKDTLVVLCGKEFMSYQKMGKELNLRAWSMTKFSQTGEITKTMKKAMISYFGKDVYDTYYPNCKVRIKSPHP